MFTSMISPATMLGAGSPGYVREGRASPTGYARGSTSYGASTHAGGGGAHAAYYGGPAGGRSGTRSASGARGHKRPSTASLKRGDTFGGGGGVMVGKLRPQSAGASRKGTNSSGHQGPPHGGMNGVPGLGGGGGGSNTTTGTRGHAGARSSLTGARALAAHDRATTEGVALEVAKYRKHLARLLHELKLGDADARYFAVAKGVGGGAPRGGAGNDNHAGTSAGGASAESELAALYHNIHQLLVIRTRTLEVINAITRREAVVYAAAAAGQSGAAPGTVGNAGGTGRPLSAHPTRRTPLGATTGGARERPMSANPTRGGAAGRGAPGAAGGVQNLPADLQTLAIIRLIDAWRAAMPPASTHDAHAPRSSDTSLWKAAPATGGGAGATVVRVFHWRGEDYEAVMAREDSGEQDVTKLPRFKGGGGGTGGSRQQQQGGGPGARRLSKATPVPQMHDRDAHRVAAAGLVSRDPSPVALPAAGLFPPFQQYRAPAEAMDMYAAHTPHPGTAPPEYHPVAQHHVQHPPQPQPFDASAHGAPQQQQRKVRSAGGAAFAVRAARELSSVTQQYAQQLNQQQQHPLPVEHAHVRAAVPLALQQQQQQQQQQQHPSWDPRAAYTAEASASPSHALRAANLSTASAPPTVAACGALAASHEVTIPHEVPPSGGVSGSVLTTPASAPTPPPTPPVRADAEPSPRRDGGKRPGGRGGGEYYSESAGAPPRDVQHPAAVKIQACFRGSLDRRRAAYERLKVQAATTIQSWVRMRHGQRRAAWWKQVNQYATMIQSNVRGYLVRRRLHKDGFLARAALRIQAHYRGWRDRRAVLRLVEQTHLETSAARVIYTQWTLYKAAKARGVAQARGRAQTRIAMAWRAHAARAVAQKLREERAAARGGQRGVASLGDAYLLEDHKRRGREMRQRYSKQQLQHPTSPSALSTSLTHRSDATRSASSVAGTPAMTPIFTTHPHPQPLPGSSKPHSTIAAGTTAGVAGHAAKTLPSPIATPMPAAAGVQAATPLTAPTPPYNADADTSLASGVGVGAGLMQQQPEQERDVATPSEGLSHLWGGRVFTPPQVLYTASFIEPIQDGDWLVLPPNVSTKPETPAPAMIPPLATTNAIRSVASLGSGFTERSVARQRAAAEADAASASATPTPSTRPPQPVRGVPTFHAGSGEGRVEAVGASDAPPSRLDPPTVIAGHTTSGSKKGDGSRGPPEKTLDVRMGMHTSSKTDTVPRGGGVDGDADTVADADAGGDGDRAVVMQHQQQQQSVPSIPTPVKPSAPATGAGAAKAVGHGGRGGGGAVPVAQRVLGGAVAVTTEEMEALRRDVEGVGRVDRDIVTTAGTRAHVMPASVGTDGGDASLMPSLGNTTLPSTYVSLVSANASVASEAPSPTAGDANPPPARPSEPQAGASTIVSEGDVHLDFGMDDHDDGHDHESNGGPAAPAAAVPAPIAAMPAVVEETPTAAVAPAIPRPLFSGGLDAEESAMLCLLQRVARGARARHAVHRLHARRCKDVVLCQAAARRFLAARRVQELMERHAAAQLIQTAWKAFWFGDATACGDMDARASARASTSSPRSAFESAVQEAEASPGDAPARGCMSSLPVGPRGSSPFASCNGSPRLSSRGGGPRTLAGGDASGNDTHAPAQLGLKHRLDATRPRMCESEAEIAYYQALKKWVRQLEGFWLGVLAARARRRGWEDYILESETRLRRVVFLQGWWRYIMAKRRNDGSERKAYLERLRRHRELKALEQTAAVIIQSVWRGYRHRTRSAAIAARCHTIRVRADRRIDSATRIQRQWRIMVTRRAVQRELHARSMSLDEQLNAELLLEGVTKIQALVRGHLTRRRLATQMEHQRHEVRIAIHVMQRVVRGFLARIYYRRNQKRLAQDRLRQIEEKRASLKAGWPEDFEYPLGNTTRVDLEDARGSDDNASKKGDGNKDANSRKNDA